MIAMVSQLSPSAAEGHSMDLEEVAVALLTLYTTVDSKPSQNCTNLKNKYTHKIPTPQTKNKQH